MQQALTNFVSGWRCQLNNIRALMLREMIMQYGRNNIGFAWVILEPMILTVGVMIVWSVGIGSDKHGIKVIDFVFTLYMPLTLWRHMSAHTVALYRRSAPLLYHHRISLFDIIFARLGLEFVSVSAALLIVWITIYSFGLASSIEHLGLLFVGWLMMAWLAGATGAIISSVTEVSETAERFVAPFQYLSLPISGAFFFVDWLPAWGQHAVLLNPMVHCYEVFRAGYFGESMTAHYDLTYFSLWAFFLTFVAVICVRWVRPKVQIN
jgi:capsular polysaccharide transport system permease protein